MKTFLALLLGIGLLIPVTPTQAQDELSGMIHFKSKGKRQADVLGRNNRGWVALRKTNETAVIEFPASQIDRIDFDLELDEEELGKWTRERSFTNIAAHIQTAITPCLSYADIENNFTEHLPPLLQALYFSEQYVELEKTAAQLMRYVPPGPVFQEALLFRASALLEQDRITEAQTLFAKAEKTQRGDALSSIYWFLQARLFMLNQDPVAAHDTFAKIIAHNPNDREWLPKALYWTVALYMEQDERPVAEAIISELDTSFPLRDWADQSRKLLKRNDCLDVTNHGYDGLYHWYPTLGVPGSQPGSGTAVHFDGRIQYVDLGTGLKFVGAPGNSFTISLWAKVERAGVLLSRGDPDSDHSNDRGFSINATGIRVRGFEPVSMRTIAGTLKGDAWRHLSLVRSIIPPELRFYENGQLSTTVPYPAVFNFSTPDTSILLAAKATPSNENKRSTFFRGALDDLQVYEAVLTGQQIKSLHKKAGASGAFATQRTELNFHNDGEEYAVSHPIRGLRGPLAIEQLNAAYSDHATSAWNIEFGATALEVIDAGDPGHRLKLNPDERLGEPLIWINRTASALPFSTVGVANLDAGQQQGHVTLVAFAETVFDFHNLGDLQPVGKKTAALTAENLGLVNLEVKTSEPALSFCLFRSDATGTPSVESNLPAATLSTIYMEYAQAPRAHFTFNEKPPADKPIKKKAETPPEEGTASDDKETP